MPAVDREGGRVLLAEKGRVALSPDGHGGTLAALAAPGPDGAPSCLDEMRARGVRTVFYFQVDNPLVQVAEPAFLGLHRGADAEVSFKVVEKVAPDERVGVVVTVDGRPQVIEYSDLPAELAERREPDGGLQLWAGSIAIHLFELEFIDRIATGGAALPFHRALKKVRHVGADGQRVEPAEPNAVKFERFIFDALPLARRWAIVETDRAVEFEPLKNATGPGLPGHRPPADERPVRRLARGGRRPGPPRRRRLGPLRHRDQPAVRPRRHRAAGQAAPGGRRRGPCTQVGTARG
jgi:UDP-N-acetylglucosamine/UDP-N-acetylgalactosamine diphosphorylase